MALTNYGELRAAIASWAERPDLATTIPDFLTIAQGKMYRGVRGSDVRTWVLPPLRIRDMIVNDTISVVSGVGDLPADWLQFETLWIDANNQGALEYYPLQTWRNLGAARQGAAGPVSAYTIDGRRIRIAPAADATLQVSYYARFAPLANDGDTDWIIENAPQIYLHGALAELWSFVGDAEREGAEAGKFAAGVRALMAGDGEAQFAGAALVMRPRVTV